MLPQVTFLPILGLSVCLCKIRNCSWVIPNVPSTFRSRSFMPLMLIPHLPQNLNGRNATGHKGGAEMAFYCWGWRVTSTVCPDCEEEYLRVSFDWAHLSLLGDGGSTDRPRGRWYRDSVMSLGTNLEETPVWGMDTLGPYRLLRSPVTATGVLPPKPCEPRGSGRDWHLELNTPHPLTLPPPHLSRNGQCEKTDRGPWRARVQGSVYDQDQGSAWDSGRVSICDQHQGSVNNRG